MLSALQTALSDSPASQVNNYSPAMLRLLANLVEQTSDVLTAADVNYKPLTWNKAAEKIYGITAKQAIGNDLQDFTRFHYHNTSREKVREIIAEQEEWRGEVSFVRPTDQKYITLIMCFKLLKDEAGAFVGHIISATDITERKEAELRLSESEKRFREMADSTPVMIWMCDENNKITYINKKWLEFTGVDICEQGYEEWTSFVHKDDLCKAKAEYDKAFEERKPCTIIYRLLTACGMYRWVQDASVPRFLSDGSFLGYIGSVTDIQDEKQKEEQLRYHATVLENVSDIVVTTDLDFKVIGWNKAAEQAYEISEADALGKLMRDLVYFTFYGTSFEKAMEVLIANGIWKGELSIENKNGETIYFLQTVKYVLDEHGNRIGFIAMGRDITDRKKIEEQLLRSEQFYRTLISDSLDGIILTNAEGVITFSSPSVKNVLGFEAEEIVGRNAFEFVHPEDIPWALDSFQKEVGENPEIKFIVVRLLKKNGEWLWCMVRGHNLLKNPYVNSVVLYFHDDTLRKKAGEALKESEKRFRDLIRDLQIGVILQDKEGKTILCNRAFAQMFNAAEEDCIGKMIEDVVVHPVHEDGRRFTPDERPTLIVTRTKKTAKDVVMGVYRQKQKDKIWLLVNADPILDDNGELLHIICSVKDITEHKRIQEKILADKITHQKQLTQATIDSQENERREIGKELHDNIGQQLTTIKLFLDLAKSTADNQTNEMLMMALKGVSDVINEVRGMSRSLVPSTLSDLGLTESIAELIESMERTQALQIEFDHFHFDEELLPQNQKLTLFRIVQEQLNNIVKHAKAEHAWISLQNDSDNILLKIQDDGCGFNVKTLRRGLGLMNIKNRAELFGGKKELISRPGEGCILKVSLPLSTVQQAS